MRAARLSLALCGTACILGVLGGASAAAAKASPGAQISFGTRGVAVSPANASPSGSNRVSAVSCSSAGNCSAVGNYLDNAGHSEGLLVDETAGQWSVGIAPALPANAAANPGTQIDGVSCSSAGNCSAVGSYRVDSGLTEGLLLTETAGVWSDGVEAELPADGGSINYDSLRSISCSSPGNCSAVGMYYDKSFPCNCLDYVHGLLLTETAGTWAPGVELALPAGGSFSAYTPSFGSVSCASAGNCTAAGTYLDGSTPELDPWRGLLVDETDGIWGPGVKAALPADGNSGEDVALNSVSCASAGNCTAVGQYNGVEHDYFCDPKYGCVGQLVSEGLLLTETAGIWSAAPAPALPANAAFGQASVDSLHSVSCSSPGNCTAVGGYFVGSFPNETGLLLTETNGHWARGVEEPGGPGDYGATSVSCVSPGDCGAVTSSGALLSETAGTWATEGTGRGSLGSVSCTPDGSCTAAGYAEHYTYPGPGWVDSGVLVGGTPVAVTLNVATDGAGSGSVSSDVGGIDCGSTCSASVPAGAVTLTAKPSPGSRLARWSGGGCSGTGVVCYPDTATSGQTVTATFALLPWGSAATVPGALALNVGGDARVTAISCTGAKTCAAGGYYRDGAGHKPFVADESNGSWGNAVRVPGIATLNHGKDAAVNSISCATPGNCAAGGYYRDVKGGYHAFVVIEKSGSWGNAREVPGTGALNVGHNAKVTSISCASPGNCAAGGYYTVGRGGHEVFVVDEKNGVWGKAISVPGAAALNVGRNASLNSISCGSSGNCAAGGTYKSSGFQAFLVHERSGVWGTAVKVPGPAALNVSVKAQVASISCATAKFCAAGGTYKDRSGKTQSFIVNGQPDKSGHWVWAKAVIVPGTAAALKVSGFAQLTSISCASADYCAAAGGYSGPDGNQAFVVSSWNGSWGNATEVPGIAKLGSASSAIAISCASAWNCAVTGSDNSSPGVFTALETDGVWENAAALYGLDALAVSGQPQVTSISCANTAATCAIGGSYGDSSSKAQPFVTAP